MMKKTNLPIGVESLVAIGAITASFAYLDSQLAFAIWLLVGSDQRLGQIITAELSFSQKVGLLSSVYRYRNDNRTTAEFEKLLKNLGKAEKDRNKVTHSVWARGGRQGVTRIKTTAKRKSGLKFVFEKMSLEDLGEIAEFIGEVANEVIDILIRQREVLSIEGILEVKSNTTLK